MPASGHKQTSTSANCSWLKRGLSSSRCDSPLAGVIPPIARAVLRLSCKVEAQILEKLR